MTVTLAAYTSGTGHGSLKEAFLCCYTLVTIIVAELERLRILKERDLGVRIEYEEGDPYVAARPVEE